MINKSLIQKLGEKEMDRKDFLKYSGLALIGIIGLKGLLSILNQSYKTADVSVKSDQTPRGFGSGKYGV